MNQIITAIQQATNRKGYLKDQIGDALQEAAKEARSTGKPASVIIELTFRPHHKHGVFGIGGNVKTRLPKIDEATHDNLIFADKDGVLHLNSPQADAFDAEDMEGVTKLTLKR